MFALDRSLKAIETAEQNIVAVYHSNFAVNAACPGVGQIKCEAYVCALLEGNVNRVYVALIDSVDRTVYVYSDGSDWNGSDSSREMVKNALDFVESLGFIMDPVNLSYGKALREVIIRGIRAFSLLPGGKKPNLSPNIPVKSIQNLPAGGGARERKLPAEEFPVEEQPASAVNGVVAPPVDEQIMSSTPQLEEGTLDVMPVDRNPVPVEDIFAGEIPADDGRPDMYESPDDGLIIDNLQVTLQQARAAENLAEVTVAEAASSLETVYAARLERERGLAEKNAVEQVLAAQVDAARCDWERTETERVDCERLLVDTVKAERSAEALFEEARRALEEARLALETASAERCGREKQLEDRAAAELLAAKSIDRVRLEWENIEAERVECENLLFQTLESEKQAEVNVASALKELEEAIAVRTEQERLLKTELDARSTARITGDVAGEVPLLVSTLHSELASPVVSGERSAAEGVAAADIFAGESAETSQSPLPQDVPAPLAEPVASPFSSPFTSPRPPFESSYGGSPFASDDEESIDSPFAIDPSLRAIELGKDDQVTDYYQSLNVVRLTIESLPSQSSSSYLCAVYRNGIYSVYFALFLSDSKRTIVYCPGKQPVTAVDKEHVLMEGVTFAETVGFIMDRITLGGREKQSELCGSSPVFALL